MCHFVEECIPFLDAPYNFFILPLPLVNTIVYPIVKDAAAFLRIGSLNVKVRKTTEAFNSLLSRDVEAKLHRSWGSSDSLPDAVRLQEKCA